MPTQKYTKTDFAGFASETLKTIEQQKKQIKDLGQKIKDNYALHKKQSANSKAAFYVDQNLPIQPITGGKTKKHNKTAQKKRAKRNSRRSRSNKK
jgi:hypothetical protein